ncbi:MAG: methyltransferase domain-containing protein [Candidatus Latescibacteria bacterium]|nr:methyltransferase domain-containing protein [Candidatus Latescibacterota bacterium]
MSNRSPKKRLDPNRPLKVAPGQVEVLVVSSIDRYRQLARELSVETDRILEIGCSTGESTRLLAQRAAQMVAVDISAELVARLQTEMAGCAKVQVAQIDGRNTPQLVALLPDPTLIFVDIGGTAHLDNVALQLRLCLKAFAPRLIVVRSFELATLASLLTLDELPETPALSPQDTSDPQAHTLQHLLDLSRCSNTDSRVFAVHRLRDLDVEAAWQRLQELVDDPHRRVRRAAQLALRKQS